MSETLAAEKTSADVPEYPMERAARCPFSPPLEMLEMNQAAPLSRVRIWNGTTPWLITEIEEATALFGADYYPYGIEQSRKAIQALCDEQFAQGLISERVDGAIAFPEFEAATKVAPLTAIG